MKNIPIGIADFDEIIINNYEFIDKSLFAKEIIDESSKVILITRPRRFGKTVNMSMLKSYFNLNHDNNHQNLFACLEINKHADFNKKHQNQYPVIFVTFKGIKPTSYEEAFEQFGLLFASLYREFSYLNNSDELLDVEKDYINKIIAAQASTAELGLALKLLSQYLHRHHQVRPIILIDEYDTPTQEAYLHGFENKIIDFMRRLLGEGLKDNSSLEKAVVTGILRIAQTNMFSDLNNISYYTVLHDKFSQYFGFLEPEVAALFNRQDIAKDKIHEVMQWYNGYRFGSHTIFNPWSILKYINENCRASSYWLGTGGQALIDELLQVSDYSVKQELTKLLQGDSVTLIINNATVFKDLRNRADELWLLLLYSGYLKAERINGDDIILASIPNREIQLAFEKIIQQWFTANSSQHYQQWLQAVISGDIEQLQQLLTTYLAESSSYFDFNNRQPEQVYHAFLLGLVVGLREQYIITSNDESGFGRCDVMLLPRDNKQAGIIIEFKVADSVEDMPNVANAALAQIAEKNYQAKLQQHGVKNSIFYGIVFHGKQVLVVSKDNL